jgi:DNA mismatch endonuclease (patch repair protein)
MRQDARKRLPTFRRPDARRTKNMRAIRSRGNKTTEARFASLLKAHAIHGWRRQPRGIVGKPDFIMPRERVTVFVDGCFFHGCPQCGHIPRTNAAYWRAKIQRNKRRDRAISRALRALGYRVVRIWECRLRTRPTSCLDRIARALAD